MNPQVPTPSTDALRSLPRQQLQELRKRIDEALGDDASQCWNNDNVVAVRLAMVVKDALVKLAAVKKCTVSDEIRVGIREYLKTQQGRLAKAGNQ
jgi:hypothetical protein